MRVFRAAVAILVVLGSAGLSDAQQVVASQSMSQRVVAAAAAAHASDGVSVARIRQRLTDARTSPFRELIAVQYSVEVHATGPVGTLFTSDDRLAIGQARYGPPTHRHFSDVFTPRPFRRPAADLNSLGRWLGIRNVK